MTSITAKFKDPEIPYVNKTVTGPASYDKTNGFSVTVSELPKVKYVEPVMDTDGTHLYLIKGTASGNEVTLRFYTISADTSTGEITTAEAADAADLSGLTFPLKVFGAVQE